MNTDDTYIKLGKNIRKYREKKGLTQEALSEMLDKNSKYIGHIERCERHVSLNMLIEIANKIDTEIKDLFDFSS